MVLGIVGSEQLKFTPETEEKARLAIRDLIDEVYFPELVVSGACHLGGVDLYAEQEARVLGVPFRSFPPKSLRWSGGYKERNLEIVRASDCVVCITVAKYPPAYPEQGMRFNYCYHCGTDSHVKSGGCYTVKKAIEFGKQGRVIVIE